MSLSRYMFAPRRQDDLNQSFVGTTRLTSNLRRAVLSGAISVNRHVLKEGERLDTLSFDFFGDSSMWWVIAGCSGIGWGMQVPPGTVLQIPTRIDQVMGYIR